ncbi:MAG: malic enzyme-like NAD(P)-binding protein [Candidatus Obscuribacterales bacterium]|nr:malic enzyme-like NAD(P)-binding protein [Candidatus Obscuribacterales bacterium]
MNTIKTDETKTPPKALRTSASYSITLRMKIKNTAGMLGKVTSKIGENGGDIGAIDIVGFEKEHVIRDITINVAGERHGEEIVNTLREMSDIEIINVSDRTFLMHLGGKIHVTSKVPLTNRDDLSMAYTPGVARVCMAIHADKEKVYNLTIKRNTIAVVTDGTAVLGLGDIGPEAALPVMEGKAMLFKEFGKLDAFPICLDTKDTEEIIKAVKLIAPVFGGINLEDISAPRCFEIEERLKKELDIPVFHDDQHGTAVVVLAALINALKIVKKEMKDLKVIVSGVGAAGVACSKILMHAGVVNIVGFDRAGAIYKGRKENMNFMKDWFADNTNPHGIKGSLQEALEGADLYMGLSGPGTIEAHFLSKMARDPIVFAMANPTPEVMPEDAAPYVRVMATGRSDYPNQINNVLCFPGIFRGALDCQASDINEEMKLAAAYAIASVVSDAELSEDYIIPGVFNPRVVETVAPAVIKAAQATGVARRAPKGIGGDDYAI